MNASDIMTPEPVSISPKATVAEAIDLLREMEIRHLPVVHHGELVGMVSDRDLREVTLPTSPDSFEDEGQAQRKGQAIADVMQADPITVGPEDDLGDVIDLLLEHRIGALPVVDDATEKLVGIVSYIDVLQAVRDLV